MSKLELGPIYAASYSWSDHDTLRRLMAGTPHPLRVAVEVAAGPNLAVARALAEIAAGILYVPVDLQERHLRLLTGRAGLLHVSPLLAQASNLPLDCGCAGLVIFHHAIDDICESEGEIGLWRVVSEAVRVLAPQGRMIFCHCVLAYDQATRLVSLPQVWSMLRGMGDWRIHQERGRLLDWMVVDGQTCQGRGQHG